jgi:hypothetical protein
MSISVEDALDMWCPFARGAIDDALAGNRNYDGESLRSCKCLAYDCMAWEYVDDSIDEGFCALMGNHVSKADRVLRVVK